MVRDSRGEEPARKPGQRSGAQATEAVCREGPGFWRIAGTGLGHPLSRGFRGEPCGGRQESVCSVS